VEEGVVAADVYIAMEALIDGQTISFDMHAAGNREPAGVKDLHMHKRMNGKKYARVQVRFPLRGGAEPLFTPPSTDNVIRRKLMTEVKSVLKKNPQKRQQLVETVIDQIERYGSTLPKPEMINAIRSGAAKIGEFFGDGGEITQEIMDSANERIKKVITKHKMNNGHFFFLKQDLTLHTISLSSSLQELSSFDGPKLSIVSAIYGAKDSHIDVTRQVRRLVDGNTLTIKSSNKLGGDPIKNVKKALTIVYKYDNGLVRTLTIREGQTDTIEP
jgi:hypothetical protein